MLLNNLCYWAIFNSYFVQIWDVFDNLLEYCEEKRDFTNGFDKQLLLSYCGIFWAGLLVLYGPWVLISTLLSLFYTILLSFPGIYLIIILLNLSLYCCIDLKNTDITNLFFLNKFIVQLLSPDVINSDDCTLTQRTNPRGRI